MRCCIELQKAYKFSLFIILNEETKSRPGIVDDMDSSEPDWETSVEEGDDALHLLQPQASQMTESEAADIVEDSHASYLGLHLSRHHLQQAVGGGIEVFQRNFVRVPAS